MTNTVYGPFSTRPGILQRSANLIDIITRNREGTTAYRLWGARSINDAYGNLTGSGVGGAGGTQILEAQAGQIVLSPSLVNRWKVEENRKGQTSFIFNIEDYVTPASPPPFGSDDEFLFIRLQERRAQGWLAVPPTAPLNANWPIQGPIMPVPTTRFFSLAAATISLQGIAPAATGSVIGSPPVFDESVQIPLPMHIVFPRPVTSIEIRNIDPTEDMLVSYGLGMPMSFLGHGDKISIFGAPGITELILADAASGSIGAGSGCQFAIDAVCDLYTE